MEKKGKARQHEAEAHQGQSRPYPGEQRPLGRKSDARILQSIHERQSVGVPAKYKLQASYGSLGTNPPGS
jgi:hypothetical protein